MAVPGRAGTAANPLHHLPVPHTADLPPLPNPPPNLAPTTHRPSHPQNFTAQTGPVVEHYRGLGKVHVVATDRPVADIYADLSALWRQRFVAAAAASPSS